MSDIFTYEYSAVRSRIRFIINRFQGSNEGRLSIILKL